MRPTTRNLDTLKAALEEWARTHRRLRNLLVHSRVELGREADEIANVEAAIGALERRIASLEATSQVDSAAGAEPVESSMPKEEAAEPRRGRPVQALVLDALDDLRWPAYARELQLYCRARYGRDIPSTRFGTLAKDEETAYRNGKRPRTVWLCHALTYHRAEAIKRLWARSDWPLERRIVAPTTGRVQHLKMTVRLCEIARDHADTASDPQMLRILAADHARDLPGVKFRRGEFPLDDWRELARKVLEEVEPRDETMRRDAAQPIGQMAEVWQLFGRPEGLAGIDDAAATRER